jgi:hypothetical protein
VEKQEKNGRLAELLKLSDDITIRPLFEKMVLLEEHMEKLEALPWIRVNPRDTTQQKSTPAFFEHQKTLSQYKELVKIVCKVCGNFEPEEESPLRVYMKKLNERDAG